MKILIAESGKVGDTLVHRLSADGCDLTVIDSNRLIACFCIGV